MLIRTCSLLLCVLLAEASANAQEKGRFAVAGFESDSTFIRFYGEFQKAVEKKDSHRLATLIAYPLIAYYGDNKKVRLNNQQDFIRTFRLLFDSRMCELVRSQSATSLFANYRGVMVGNGQVWFGVLESDSSIVIISLHNTDHLFRAR